MASSLRSRTRSAAAGHMAKAAKAAMADEQPAAAGGGGSTRGSWCRCGQGSAQWSGGVEGGLDSVSRGAVLNECGIEAFSISGIRGSLAAEGGGHSLRVSLGGLQLLDSQAIPRAWVDAWSCVGVESDVEETDGHCSLSLHAYPTSAPSTLAALAGSKPVRRHERWQVRVGDRHAALALLEALRRVLREGFRPVARDYERTPDDAVEQQDPVPVRQMLAVISPKSGSGSAAQLWRTLWQPMLAHAGVVVTEVTTEYARHATKIAEEADLSGLSGILVAGGDGVLNEVVRGLMHRPDWREALRVPLGSLAAGSGNGLAKSLCWLGFEPWDPMTTCFLAAKGVLLKHDLASVFPATTDDGTCVDADPKEDGPNDNLLSRVPHEKRQFSFLGLEWGVIADVDIESEQYRWMGNERFTAGGVVRLLWRRHYKGKISYLPATEIAYAAEEEPVGEVTWHERTHRTHGRGQHGNRLPVVHCVPAAEAVPEDWVTVEGEFFHLQASLIPYLTQDLSITLDTRMGDGIMYLQFTEAPDFVSSANMLLSLDDQGTLSRTAGITTVPVRAMRLEPTDDWYRQGLDRFRAGAGAVQGKPCHPPPSEEGARPGGGGFINVDGEVEAYGPLQCEVHPRMMTMFGVQRRA